MTTPEWLEQAARRSKREHWMLGHAFDKYRQLEGMSEEGLAKELGCSMETLHWMALCRRPTSERFKDETVAIAKQHGVDEFLLLQVLGRLNVVEVFRPPPAGGPVQQDAILMAAQDREPDDETDT